MTEIIIINVIILIFEIVLSIAGVVLAWLSAKQFAKELGTGMRLLAFGMLFMVLNFFFGMIDHMQIGGVILPFVHPGWLHGTTILLALAIILMGFYKIYKGALAVRKTSIAEESKK